MSDPRFSHLDAEGTARMVDVGAKPVQRRIAVAAGFVACAPATIPALRDRALPKGDVLTVARIAAIQAAKRTDELIPLCHSLPLDAVDVDFEVRDDGVAIRADRQHHGENRASRWKRSPRCRVAALTIYDMCKAVDKAMVIGDIRVIEKIKE